MLNLVRLLPKFLLIFSLLVFGFRVRHFNNFLSVFRIFDSLGDAPLDHLLQLALTHTFGFLFLILELFLFFLALFHHFQRFVIQPFLELLLLYLSFKRDFL